MTTDWKKPAKSMTDEELGSALCDIVADIERFHALPADDKEHGGSPGEWMYERLNEIETEATRRFMPPPC
jgi:transposase